MSPRKNIYISALVMHSVLTVVIVLCCGCEQWARRAPQADFFVAPDGHDAWSGRLPAANAHGTDGAFATLQKARDAVRQLKATGRPQGPFVVMVRGGTYYMNEPLVLGPEDSGTADCPVIYSAYPGEQVVLSGGRLITNWYKGPNQLWVADLPEVADGKWYFRQLFVGNERRIRARTPNFDTQQPITGGWCFVLPFGEDDSVPDAPKGRKGHYKDRFRFRPGDVSRWPMSPEPEIHIFPAWGWVNAILSVADIDYEKNIVHVRNRNCTKGLRPGCRYFIENVFEALDTPGEWYLDKNKGRLYYRPKDEDFAKKEIIAPMLDRIIDINGPTPNQEKPGFVEHVVIRGFTFRHTKYSLEMDSVYMPDDGTVRLNRTRHCVVENCKFLGVGGNGVRLSGQAGNNYILGNTIAEAGQGGVILISDQTENQPINNTIAGNHIHHCGKIWKHSLGVHATTSSGNRIAHNTITDMPRIGIGCGSFNKTNVSHNNIFEYNRICRTNLETNDCAAIYTLGRDREDSGNVIRYNLILDVVGLKTTEKGEILTPFKTWGIYLDDYSSGVQVYGNIVARAFRGGLLVHRGRNNVIENNIFVDSHEQQYEFAQPESMDFMVNNKFVNNIVYFKRGNLLSIRGFNDKVLAECDYNLYWRADGKLNDAEGKVTPLGPLADWRKGGYDQNSMVADPLFVDADNDDYRLKPGSPAFKLGFKPIDVEKIGVRGYIRPANLP